MRIDQKQLEYELNSACRRDARLQRILERVGCPEPRYREPGFATLAGIINAQQLSTRAAAAIWLRLERSCRGEVTIRKVLNRDTPQLMECGLSARKADYIRSLAESIRSKDLDLDWIQRLDDDSLVLELTKIRGLGRWSAEIYAMFALGRPDLFPAGDLALRVSVQRLCRRRTTMDESQVRRYASRWSPHRSAVALLMWKYYGATTLE